MNKILKKKNYGYIDLAGLSFALSPVYSAVFALDRLIMSLIPAADVFVSAKFIDTTVSFFHGNAQLKDLYLPIGLLIGLMFYSTLSGSVMNLIGTYRNIYFRKRLVPEVINHRVNLDYKYMEDNKSLDLIHRVFPEIEMRVWNMYDLVLNVAGLVVYVLGIIFTIITQVWWVGLTMLVTIAPMVWLSYKAGRETYHADKEMTEIDRIQWNLSWILSDRENVEERTVYGYSGRLNEKYLDKFEYARKHRLKVKGKNFSKQKMGGVLTTAYTIFVTFVLLPAVFQGDISIGMFIALVGAVLNLSRNLSWGVNHHVLEIVRQREWLRDLTEFVHLDTTAGATALPSAPKPFSVIEFRNVIFSYPETDKKILDRASFTIKSGLHYSFVGENGAGKTTITKLLTGLYTNYEGEILIDGRELRAFSQEEIKALTSVVYQDFAKYFLSAYDNVALGDVSNMDDKERVERAIESVGLSEAIENLPNRIDTPLGKILKDGVDFSGGQWQRLAMARSVLSKAPLKILDEPTSALDPIAETAIYKSFEDITQGQTTIFISHRLGSTKLADIIYVLDKGRIAEEGSHEELRAKGGIYAKMYEAQAGWYA